MKNFGFEISKKSLPIHTDKRKYPTVIFVRYIFREERFTETQYFGLNWELLQLESDISTVSVHTYNHFFRFFLFPVIDDINKLHSLTLNKPLVNMTLLKSVNNRFSR